MATESSSSAIDMQKLINGAVELELKALSAGVEYSQVWINQAAKLSAIAADTLRAMQDGKASLPGTTRRLTEFAQQNAEAFGEVTTRLGKRYFDEVGRVSAAVGTATRRMAEQATEKGAREVAVVAARAETAAASVKATAQRKPARPK